MLSVLFVCTANICRSPLAEALLAHRLDDARVRIASAGTRARPDIPMSSSSARLAIADGVDPAAAAGHRSQRLDADLIARADLVVAMDRSHRRFVVEEDPRATRRTFTARELLRLESAGETVEGPEGVEPQLRLAAILVELVSRRPLVRDAEPADDDIADPYGLDEADYLRMHDALVPAVDTVARIVRAATG